MKEYDDGLYLCLRNHLVPGEKLSFKSRKKDGGEHGIGMQIIESLVKKYHGTKAFDWNQEKNLLTETIRLKSVQG